MGDLRIMDPRMDPRFTDAKHRGWPPMYRTPPSRGPSFCYRPVPVEPMPQWIPQHDYNYFPAPRMPQNKGRDYYYLTPLYRNAMPPPPIQIPAMGISPKMMVMQDGGVRGRTRGSSGQGRHSVPPCTCSVGRTRSLEDVRSEVSEWEEYNDENGNNLPVIKNGLHGRRSMENLLDVDGREKFDKSGKLDRIDESNDKVNGIKSPRRRGSYMVRFFN